MRCFLSKSQDAMDMGADVRHATHSAVPSGLMQFQIPVPNVETLGYYRPSLRDDEWQILVALDILVRLRVDRTGEADKNVRPPIVVFAQFWLDTSTFFLLVVP